MRLLLLLLVAGLPAAALPAAAQPEARLRGGTLRLLAGSAAGSLDPQINYTVEYWQLFSFTHDGLVAFRKVPGPEGLQIVPDLAEAVPAPGDGGLNYVFRLRRGIRFSDGSEVRPEDVVASLRRIFRVRAPTAQTFYGAIDGAAACDQDAAGCRLPGVSAEGDRITIRLTRPDPEFLVKLALPPASILPASAPAEDAGTAPLPGTGPYALAAYDPTAQLRIVRNPHFRQWSADAQPDGYPDEIRLEFGLGAEAEVTAIENGQADWMFDTPPPDRLPELGARFAEQVHVQPAFAINYVPLNVRLAPFDDVRVRWAFNMAVDRDALVKLFGGHRLATPLCQVLPPGLPGHAPYCPFAHDLDAARRLVRESGTAGQVVTLVTDDSAGAAKAGTYLREVLSDLGYVAKLRFLSGSVQFSYIQNTANRVQASLTNWYGDYPSAANFLGGMFGCAAFRPGSDSSPNISGFCDPALDAAVARALAAADLAGLAEADRRLTDQAPAVVLNAPKYIDFVSARIGNYGYHEVFRWLVPRSFVRPDGAAAGP